MPYRVHNLILATLGLLTVAGLLLVGANLHRHRLEGSALKKRLVIAGLSLLSLFGLGSLVTQSGCTKTSTSSQARGTTAKPDKSTPKDPATSSSPRGRIDEVTAEAKAVASGKRGEHPFDRKGKERLLAAMDEAEQDVDALVTAGTISEGAGGLWKQDLRLLAARVGEYRPAEMKNTSCYEPMPMPIKAHKSMVRLKARAASLEKLAVAKKLNPEVVKKVLVQVEEDLAVLQSEGELADLRDDKARAEARELAKQADAHLQRVKAALNSQGSPAKK